MIDYRLQTPLSAHALQADEPKRRRRCTINTIAAAAAASTTASTIQEAAFIGPAKLYGMLRRPPPRPQGIGTI